MLRDWKGGSDVGTVLAEENARDGHVSHRHALVVALSISACQWIIEHAGRNVSLPKHVIGRGTGCPKGATGAFACGQSGGGQVAEHKGKDIQLLECFHEAENEGTDMRGSSC